MKIEFAVVTSGRNVKQFARHEDAHKLADSLNQLRRDVEKQLGRPSRDLAQFTVEPVPAY